MDRRGFLKFLGAGVAGIALEQAIPLNRVWSFPKNIVIPKPATYIGVDFGYGLEIGDIVTVNVPGFEHTLFKVAAITEQGRKINLLRHDLLLRNIPIVNVDSRAFYSGGPPTLPPVAQLKSPFTPHLLPALGIPES